MAYMTDEEATRLDEKWTKTPPKPGPNGTGYFTRCKNAAHTITIDNVTATYLLAKATAVQKTPAELIGEMVWEQMKVAM